ncbi:MAG: IS110 family transposase [Hydrotalea sp. AMD]|uniref:IS110 family transposase n=1 Tax=Hydrotalea sp. AMD TaxID=2501297 RepID=UPI0010259195|nr:IS110 family transposase [Hydrotalea sp. AMD]RWZ87871.1 MAG: IS110 family transposase [Hydrotalea sp. AMD]
MNDLFIRNIHQNPSPQVMVDYLHKHFPGAVFKATYEAGKFGFWIQRQLTQLGVECMVVNPADILRSQKDTLNKSDPRDARNLGLRLQSGVLKGIHIPDEQQEADRVLFRQRKKLWSDLNRCKNRIKGLLAFTGIDIPEQYDTASWSHNFIKWLRALDCKQISRRTALDFMITQMEFLRKELLSISNAIRKMMREQRYKKNYYLLRSIPGIGPLTAASLLVEIGDVKRFETFYHLNSFVGLMPMEHSSGENETRGSLTVRKHRQLRSDLVESAWVAKRVDPAMALFFQEQIKRKECRTVIIKIARKLLHRIRYVLVHQQPYEMGVVK